MARRSPLAAQLVAGHDGVDQQLLNADSSGNLLVGGPAVDDAAASGNPVPVGGIYNTTLPTYSNLDRTQLQSGSRGSLAVTLFAQDSTAVAGISSVGTDGLNADNLSGAVNGLRTASHIMQWDGTNWDLGRSIITGTDSVGTGIAAAGILAQLDDTSPSTVTENQFGNIRMGSDRILLVHEQGKSFSNITAAAPTTTTVKSSAGHFHTLTINKSAANGVITIYDNTAGSGTLIATITQPAALLSSGPVTVTYDVAFATGLTLVTSGAAQDITVSYR